jgi:site-specific DNA-methyltransferase (adenine-specific)
MQVAEVLVQQSSEPGEIVIDPFVGAGSTGMAAVRHGRRFGGNDTCEEAVEITRKRLIAEGGEETGPPYSSREDDDEQLGLSL